MDAASSGDAASGMAYEPGARPLPSRFQWLWAPLALGAAFALVNLSIALLARTGLYLLLINYQFSSTRQSEFNAGVIVIDELFLPVMVIVIALIFSFRTQPGARRGAVAARLLGALALMVGGIMLHPVVAAAEFRALFGAQNTQSSLFLTNSATVLLDPLVSGFVLGVTLVAVLGALAPQPAPARHAARIGYWMFAGVLAGIAVTFMSQEEHVVQLAIEALSLAAAGETGCTANSGAGCYSGQMLDLARQSVLPLLIGAIVGGAAGGLLRLESTPPGLQGAAVPERTPAAPTRRGGRIVGALRYIAGGVIGALYLALVVALTTLAVSLIYRFNPVNTTQPVIRGLILVTFSLLIPAGWLALTGARARLATALNPAGKRALRWALALLSALLAVAVPIVTIATNSILIGYGFSGLGLPTIILAAFSLGATYGLLWSPQPRSSRPRAAWRAGARAAVTGWLGVSLPVAILVGIEVYALVTPSLPTAGCHGLACGALLMSAFIILIGGGVNIIVFGLPAALFAGSLSGMIREALRAS